MFFYFKKIYYNKYKWNKAKQFDSAYDLIGNN